MSFSLRRAHATLLAGVLFFVLPVTVFAAGLGTPLVPQTDINGSALTCPLGYGAFFLLIQNVLVDAVILASIFAVLLIAYAGFLFVINPASPDGVSKGKTVLTNTVIGFIVVLVAWLLVSELISVFTTGSMTSVTSLLNPSAKSLCLPIGAPTVSSVQPSSVGVVEQVPTVGPSGNAVMVSFSTTQPDVALQVGYVAASTYSAEIGSACSGSSVPNCITVVTAIIAQESNGNPAATCNAAGACGIMQLTQANGGTSCAVADTNCIQSQINTGVTLFQKGYNVFSNIPNALAAYNSGITTQAGQSVSGRNSAMVASADCPGYYAWQCTKNPGGLAQTQGYVANICRRIAMNNGAC
ncbi:MAG: hypothetical protein B7X04_02995 [Parcubacteria group bacterium 21-54-25]|nr:MAG: hypothetical protein B7X04_02995 [Parcubacteria group bacterium 21-54-25]HQU07921.1 lytic transglycosylase domain-containing protein [Candidatus Paceibacterota bacterium]